MKRALLIFSILWVAFIANALLHAPASAATIAINAPPALEMRAKFPDVPAKSIDAIAFINKTVNGRLSYLSDELHYGKRDRWVQDPPDDKGDCEDYVITKWRVLAEAGFSTVSHARIRNAQVGIVGHVVLELRMENGQKVFLDNGYNDLMTRAELEARGYKFFDW